MGQSPVKLEQHEAPRPSVRRAGPLVPRWERGRAALPPRSRGAGGDGDAAAGVTEGHCDAAVSRRRRHARRGPAAAN